MTDEEFWNYARQRAHVVPEQLLHEEYTECRLSNATCLVALRGLAEVLLPPYRLARLPDVPGWMAGIMAWRGETIAVVDLNSYLQSVQKADVSLVKEGTLLVANHANQTVGLLVASLGFTEAIPSEQIVPPSDLTSLTLGEHAGLIEGFYQDVPVINGAVLLDTLVQQIGMMADHG